MGILSWIILGLLVGILAKWIMPGKDDIGLFRTILLGIAGALVGGFLSSRLGMSNVDGINVSSVVIAVLGAILVLFIYRKLKQ